METFDFIRKIGQEGLFYDEDNDSLDKKTNNLLNIHKKVIEAYPGTGDHSRHLPISLALNTFSNQINKANIARIHGLDTVRNVCHTLFGYDLRLSLSVAPIQELPMENLRRILILGETGSGKENFANIIGETLRVLYMNLAKKEAEEFINGETTYDKIFSKKKLNFHKLSIAEFSDDLIESELFGYVGGMYTDAKQEGKDGILKEANGGIIFLDEIGEISKYTQRKLLRAIQTGEIRKVGSLEPETSKFHLISATNRDIKDFTKEKGFREDLYYRIAKPPLNIPPLVEILKGKNATERKKIFNAIFSCIDLNLKDTTGFVTNKITEMEIKFSAELEDYPWTGNLRECTDLLVRSLYLGKLSTEIKHNPAEEITITDDLSEMINTYEKKIIKEAHRIMKEEEISEQKMANKLNIARQTFDRKLKKYGLK